MFKIFENFSDDLIVEGSFSELYFNHSYGTQQVSAQSSFYVPSHITDITSDLSLSLPVPMLIHHHHSEDDHVCDHTHDCDCEEQDHDAHNHDINGDLLHHHNHDEDYHHHTDSEDETIGSPNLVTPFNGPTGDNKADFDYDAAAIQLTRGLLKYGDGVYGTTGNELGTSAALTWSFAATPDEGREQVTVNQMLFIIRAIGSVEDIVDVSFTRIGSGTTGADAFADGAEMYFQNEDTSGGGLANYSFYPGSGDQLGEVVSTAVMIGGTANYIDDDDYGMSVTLHEIAHGLGLSHPGDYNGGNPSYADDAIYFQDSRQYTVMSYFDATNTGADHFEWVLNDAGTDYIAVGGYATNFLLHDIAALQRLYGANETTRDGDTVYGFNSNTNDASWELSDKYDSIIAAVWDGGGIDTLDVSGFDVTADIDLREEAFSSFGHLTWNFSIARGVIIENAIGGAAADTILGNAADNELTGNGGDDVLRGDTGDDIIYGGEGDDEIHGGDGIDVMHGGDGDDVIYADSEDRLNQLSGGEGNDTLYALAELHDGTDFHAAGFETVEIRNNVDQVILSLSTIGDVRTLSEFDRIDFENWTSKTSEYHVLFMTVVWILRPALTLMGARHGIAK